ncbi:MAG: ABC transporter permease [Gammaproteobacteria bacterium]|nr:ABC transporter permease [Gammaproteobacteria bacterium]
MFAYNLRLALISVKKNPILTALMIGAIAIGIGVFMTTLTVFYLMSDNPIDRKNSQLYAVTIDSWDPEDPWDDDNPERPPTELTYKDAVNLQKSGIPDRKTIMHKGGFILQPVNEEVTPFRVISRMTMNDFFPMFEVPFLYGGGWDDQADELGDYVVVLSKETNEKVFGGENSVGERFKMDDNYYTVVGVIDEFNPMPKFYDLNNGSFDNGEDVYVPFALTEQLEMYSYGNTNCWKDESYETFLDFINGECVWIQMWAELNTAATRDEFQNYVDAYVMEQKELDRFPRPLNNQLYAVDRWLESNEVVSDDNRVLVGLAVMFLAVCLLNTVGLLLAKFLGKSGEISVRRALGASKANIFQQQLIEVGMLGIFGGIVGLIFAGLGLLAVEAMYTGYEGDIQLDIVMAAAAIFVSITASVLAGIYPSWRICQTPPATYLKTQ